MRKPHGRLRAALIELGGSLEAAYDILKQENVINMSRSTFSQRLNRKSDWQLHKEVTPMCQYLKKPLEIFLDSDTEIS